MLDRPPPVKSPRQAVSAAMDKARAYLLAAQSGDGRWRDYDLPVGQSDGWITAVTALHLLDHGGAQAEQCHQAARRAAACLCVGGQGRWGYNASTPPDADSTAWAALLMVRLGRADAVDRAFLAAHQQTGGGVSTYLGGDGWGRPHGCVTALAALAFAALDMPAQAASARNWLRQSGAGARGGHWWASPFYPAWAVSHAFAGQADAPPLPALDVASSVLDLACALRISAQAGQGAPDLTRTLCALQDGDGGWPPSAALRVTHPWLTCPQRAKDAGRVYSDTRRLFGTCFCLAALSAQSALQTGGFAP